MRSRITMVVATAVLAAGISGCSANNKQSESEKPMKNDVIHYEKRTDYQKQQNEQNKANGEHTGYEQSKQSRINEDSSGVYSDVFTNKQTVKAQQHLASFKEIKQAQVAAADDRVVVSVMLNKHVKDNVADRIRGEMKQFFPDKKIYIYTDDSHYRRIRNIRSKLTPPLDQVRSRQIIDDLIDMHR
ncbi:YhcN/YlaJ family sporulation lipoprotein [Virgibacillus sp. 179-BFC.A HS]|uniref:YhcN/YlaJ family sporulation lipoprotein n=1 Tax=Tigheibacillus jepli TaxID=3035914 RepID=A0ABU5CGQ3_9BACI|nr:YhcN/YlaJ family sporulation lipoprotein [Virgibacillus sp. 179-BFC.A HS]MDY0405466.1 YhcN/YlaJ family sporulation lipoprotein [Virgibacillus sp. 179-BFC.A HS]